VNGERFKIAVVTNIVLEPHFVPLMKRRFGNGVEITPVPYDEHTEAEYKDQLIESDMVIVWLNFESLFPDIWNMLLSKTKAKHEIISGILTMYQKLYSDLMVQTNCKILWLLFEDYYVNLPTVTGYAPLFNGLVDRINIKISDTLTENNNVSLVDLKLLIATIGIPNAFEPKTKYRWNAPYSKALVEATVKEIHKQYLIEKGITKKCLVLDCDNVLWGGILSEDGIENIKLGSSGFGRAYHDFQRFLLFLYYHGVILAICSKNDSSDITTMFREHSEMILREEYIACFQVNWDSKPENIKHIAEMLNIGLDSLVFVDDSLIEIEAVKAILPEVTVIQYERDTVYEQLSCFNLKSNVNIADIKKRNETYHTNQTREALKSQYDSYADYINALDIKLYIHEAVPIEFSRISELMQRTNKCTNGQRYTIAQIKDQVENSAAKLYSLSVSDRFSDLGLVGALEVEGNSLTLFSLSCRALGRKIEEKMLTFITDKYQIKVIEFKSTGKNEEIKGLLLKTFIDATIVAL